MCCVQIARSLTLFSIHTCLNHTINMNQMIMQMNNKKAVSESLISPRRPVVFGCPFEKRLGK